MAKRGLKWGLLCAILLSTLATISVAQDETDGAEEDAVESADPVWDGSCDPLPDEYDTYNDKDCEALIAEDAGLAKTCEKYLQTACAKCPELIAGGEVKDAAECQKNIFTVNNPDGTPLGVNCGDGLIIPIWRPFSKMTGGDRFGRGLLYILFMVYLFIGVSIVSDRFMESIEMITAQEKEVTVKDPKSGKNQVIIVKVWNETVANLSLMALGSSAPEILLSVVEIWAKGFEAGDLGPGTIVGSAAFNLFMIIGLCIYVIPDDEVRKIKHLRVFIVTATWSVFAYIWMYVIIGPVSTGEVEVWEGVLTFIFFPLTVWTAYVADRRLLCYKYMSKTYRAGKGGMMKRKKKKVAEKKVKRVKKRCRPAETTSCTF